MSNDGVATAFYLEAASKKKVRNMEYGDVYFDHLFWSLIHTDHSYGIHFGVGLEEEATTGETALCVSIDMFGIMLCFGWIFD